MAWRTILTILVLGGGEAKGDRKKYQKEGSFWPRLSEVNTGGHDKGRLKLLGKRSS